MRALRISLAALASALCAVLVLGALAYGVLAHLGFQPEPVLSGSMRPTMPVGSIAFVRPVRADQVQRGDVISFTPPGERGTLVTHRVIAISHGPQGRLFRTQGDANPAPDPWRVRLPGRVGRLAFAVPYAGYAVVYAATPDVHVALIVAAAVMALVMCLCHIWRREPDPAREPTLAVSSS